MPVQVLLEAGGVRSFWNWNYRRLLGSQHGCWELSFFSLYKQCALLTTELSNLSSPSFCFLKYREILGFEIVYLTNKNKS